jgi:Flp pilus assembly protein TadG
MPAICKRSTGRRGAAAVEFAVIAPVLVFFLIGMWEVGRLVQITQILDNAAREGARQAASGQNTNAQVQLLVCQYLKNAGLPDYTASSSSYVTVKDLTNPGTDASSASSMDQLQVTVTIPYSAVRWSSLSLITNSSTTLNGQATWCCSVDQQYPTTITAPAGF